MITITFYCVTRYEDIKPIYLLLGLTCDHDVDASLGSQTITCYEVITTTTTSTSAASVCEESGATLVSQGDSSSVAYMGSLLTTLSITSVWLGIVNQRSTNWKWRDGTDLGKYDSRSSTILKRSAQYSVATYLDELHTSLCMLYVLKILKRPL